MEVKNNKRKVIGIVAGLLLICGIGLAVGILNRAEPVEDSLADTQNEVMTSQEENVANTQLPETTPETVSNTAKEEPKIDPTLTGDSILSSGLSLREAWAFYNEAKKNNEELGLSAEETNEFLNNMLFDLGTTLAQLEYCNNAGMFNEQQQVAQTPVPSKPTQQQPPKTSEPNTSNLPDGVLERSVGYFGDENGNYMHEYVYTKAGSTVNTYKMDSKGEYTILLKTEFSLYASYDSYEDIPDDSKDLFIGFTDGTWMRKDVNIYEFSEQIPSDKVAKYEKDSKDGYWHYNADLYASYEDIPDYEKKSGYPMQDGRWKVVGMYSLPSKSSFSKSAESVYSTYDDIPSFLRHAYDQHEDGKWYKNSYWQGH
ncbi:hypothetical protein [Candidatus Formimonas warabiya]|uniref:Uncharacterized protein n=1 Tax=Formimonas warabiya TaxID=1761012 RepID=A0A3G1KT51_FORW1|nr:hypothetical protein [Candidatus Formimonas warabiya]ATW25629.1 hypothetical protein DCMF_13435 [Candidatus Formimonas warabiya]